MVRFFFIFCFLLKTSFPINFQDKKGHYSISNLSTWRTTKIDDKTYRFKGSGNPLKAVYKFPNILLIAKEVEGTFQLKPQPMISQIDLKKDVSIEFTGVEKRQTTLISSSVSYDSRLSRVLIPGSFKLNSFHESQKIMIEGTRGEIFLYPSGSKKVNLPLKGSVEGPVLFEIRGLKKSGDLKSSPIVFKGKADRLVFDDSQHRMTLTGNVFIDTDQESFSGTLDANEAVLEFDEVYQILDMELDGAPGHTVLTPKKTRSS